MKNYIKIAFLLATAWTITACEKDEGGKEPPIAAGSVEVRGTLVDIRTLAAGEKVFPQHDRYTFGQDADNLFDQPAVYAAGLMESRGAEAFRCGSAGTVCLATDCADMQAEGWTRTDKTLAVNDIPYYVYSYDYGTPGKWAAVPDPAGRKYTTLLFAQQLSVAGVTVPGTVIAQVPVLRGSNINNVSMTILPGGEYIASCTGATGPGARGVTLFTSQDKGRTWKMLSQDNLDANGIANYNNIFVHDGTLYMMGTGVGGQDVLITRSTDNGRTWSYPSGEQDGVLLRGSYHSSSVPVVVSGGRIWRAMESVSDNKKSAFVMSAPADADLLRADSWTSTNTFAIEASTDTGDASISEAIEGNMVATPEGKLYNILRASSTTTSMKACKLTVTDETELKYGGVNDMINLPGGGKKFTIRYDERSRRYWAITNPASSNTNGMEHNGIYANGITYDLVRNRMVLCYSTDLSTWIQYKGIVSDVDPFFHGFQYADWMFDGDDIVAVCRMACPESRGLPVRQHDANFMAFFRIRDFRNL